jgi:hypothetical protein
VFSLRVEPPSSVIRPGSCPLRNKLLIILRTPSSPQPMKWITVTLQMFQLSRLVKRSKLNWCLAIYRNLYEAVSKSFRTGRLERELQMVQLSATRYSCIAILWVSLVCFAAITLCVASLLLLILLPLLPLEHWGVCLEIPRLPLLLRITVYSRQVVSLALEARYLG